MSFSTKQVASEFYVAVEDKWEALAALAAWARGHLARGGEPVAWLRAIGDAATLEEALLLFAWQATTDDAGNIVALQYMRPSWAPLPAEFSAIAPYVRAGSYITMHSEDFTGKSAGRGYVEESVTFDSATARETLRVIIA